MLPRLSCTAGSAAPGWGTRWRGPRSPGLVPGPRRDLAHRRASCRHRVPALPRPRRPGSVPARRRRAVLRRPLAPAPPPHPTPLPTCRPRPPRLVTQRHHTTAQRLGYSAGRCASSRPDRRPLKRAPQAQRSGSCLEHNSHSLSAWADAPTGAPVPSAAPARGTPASSGWYVAGLPKITNTQHPKEPVTCGNANSVTSQPDR